MSNASGTGCMGLLLFMALNGSLVEAVICLHPLLLVHLILIDVSLATVVLCYTSLIQRAGPVVAIAVAKSRARWRLLFSPTISIPKSFSPKYKLLLDSWSSAWDFDEQLYQAEKQKR